MAGNWWDADKIEGPASAGNWWDADAVVKDDAPSAATAGPDAKGDGFFSMERAKGVLSSLANAVPFVGADDGKPNPFAEYVKGAAERARGNLPVLEDGTLKPAEPKKFKSVLETQAWPDTVPSDDELRRLSRRDYAKAQEDEARRIRTGGHEMRATKPAPVLSAAEAGAKRFAEDNPVTASIKSSAAQSLAGLANAPSAAAQAGNEMVRNAMIGFGADVPASRVPNMPLVDDLMKMSGAYTSELQRRAPGEAWDRGEFGQWLLTQLGGNSMNTIQSLGALMVPGMQGALLTSMGATAAGTSYATGDSGIASIGKGVVEAASEKLPLEAAGFATKKVSSLIEKIPAASRNAILQDAGRRLVAAGGAVTFNSLVGAIEESAAQIGGNAIDIAIDGKTKSLFDEVDRAAIVGAAANTSMAAPAIIEAARRPTTDAGRLAGELADALNGGQFAQAGIDQTVSDMLRTVGTSVNIAPAATSKAAAAAAVERARLEQMRAPRPTVADIGKAASVDEAIATAEQSVAPDVAPAAQPTQAQAGTGRAVQLDEADLLKRAMAGIGIPQDAAPLAPAQAAPVVEQHAAPEVATPAAQDQPVRTWFGRRGDGYATPEDAQRGLSERQRLQKDLQWRIEQTPEGRYRLAGYAAPVGGTQALQTPQPQVGPVAAKPLPAARTASQGQDIILQNRDRNTPASIDQMQSIAANPDYLRAGPSRTMDQGAPVAFGAMPQSAVQGRVETVADGRGQRIQTQYAVVEAADLLASNQADGTPVPEYAAGESGRLRVVAGNGRTAGLQAAYLRGTAAQYREELQQDAQSLGIDPQAVAAMREPVLIRVMNEADVTPDIADRSNIQAGAEMSAVERANNDARRIHVSDMEFHDNGTPTEASLLRFIQSMPVSERGGLVDDKGPTQQAIDRVIAVAFKQAYGGDELVRLFAQATDPESRVVIGALARIAGRMAQLDGAGAFDIRGAVADAAGMAITAKRRGKKLSDIVLQGDLDLSPEAVVVARFMADNIRSGQRIADGLLAWVDLALDQVRIVEQNASSTGMFGEEPTLSRQQLFERLGKNGNTATAIEEPAAQRGGAVAAGEGAERREAEPAGDGRGAEDGAGGRGAETEGSGQQVERAPSVGQDLLGDKPNTSQQQAADERARRASQDQQRRNAAPAPEEFALGMEDARTGREVDPNQQELLGGLEQEAPANDFTADIAQAERDLADLQAQHQAARGKKREELAGRMERLAQEIELLRGVAEAQAERRERADAQRDGFALTGSDRAADDPNQNDLVGNSTAALVEGNGGLKFSRRAQTSTERNLVITHNLTPENLLHAARMGGLAAPSLAITTNTEALDTFGSITLIGKKEMADPKGYAGTKAFGADIYSPRYPQFERVIAKKPYAELERHTQAMADKLGEHLPYAMDLSRDGYDTLERSPVMLGQFLQDNGIEPAMVWRPGMEPGRAQRLREFGLGPFLQETDTFELTRNPEFRQAALAELIDMYEDMQDRGRMVDLLKRDEDTQDNLVRNVAVEIARAALLARRPQLDGYKTYQAMRHQLEDANLRDQYQQAVNDALEGMTDGERIFNGFTNSGNRRYIPHTLENVVKILKKELRGGESFHYGVGSLRAHFTPQFRSVEAIRKAKDKLVPVQQFEELKKEIDAEFFQVSEAFGATLPSDTVVSILQDAAKVGVARAAKTYGVTASDSAIDLANDFLAKLRDLPTAYFEAKILRPVSLSEFAGAVVPQHLSERAMQVLRDSGITDIRTYNPDEPGARKMAVQVFTERMGDEVLFSRSASTQASYEARIDQQNMENLLRAAGNAPVAKNLNGVLYGRDAQPRKSGSTVSTITDAIRQAYGPVLPQLQANGLVTLVQSQDEAIEAAAQARAAKTGQPVEQARATLRASVKNSVADQTQTEKFQRWFKDSKVVDADGNPLVVYHGSSRDIEIFAAGADEAGQSNGNRTGAWGSYFTPSAAEASIYAEIAGGDSPQNVVPVYLAIRNPYVMNRAEWGKHSQRTAKAATSAEGRADAKAVRAGIEALGHDGIVIRDRGFNDEWVAFRPEQIKSSIGNNGDFDPANPDIRRSADGSIQGFYDPQSGQSFLIADGLTEAAAPGVLAHEVGIHMAADTSSDKGKAAFDKITARAGQLLELGRGNVFFDRVNQRMRDAGETSNEEAAAYIAEEYERDRVNAPASVKRWITDFMAAVRAWLFGKGVMVKASDLGAADIAAIARANVRAAAKGSVSNGGLDGQLRRSDASPTENEVRALVQQYARTDGAPTEAQIREAVRQFRETDRAYGGRDGYQKTKAAGKTKLTYGQWVQVRTPNFKNWFGDWENDPANASKVVDSKTGEPLVVYHGTGRDFAVFDDAAQSSHIPLPGFYFSPDPDIASSFAESAAKLDENRAGRPFAPIGANVIAVHLSLQNPAEIDASNAAHGGRMPSEKVIKALLQEAQKQGHDGAVIRGWTDGSGPVQYVAFHPEQVKSAIGNIGTFDGEKGDIRFSYATKAAQGSTYTLSEERFGGLRRKMQDYFIRALEVQKAVARQGGTVDEQTDFYRAEELSSGRRAALVQDFGNNVVNPLMERAAALGVDLQELALYAYAKHAQERNEYIATINDRLPDGGSGMTTADANAIMDKVRQEGREQAFEELHQGLMDITASTRALQLSEGLITQDEFDAMQAQYKNYIPLRGFEQVDENGQPTGRSPGKGFNIRGQENLRALGRSSRAGELIENAIHDYIRTVDRGERNQVGKVFLNFVLKNPDAGLWEVDAERTRAAMDRQTGKVKGVTSIDKGEDTIAVKVAGREVYVRIHDPLLLRAMRKSHTDDRGDNERLVVRALGLYTALLRNTLTRYNPEFALTNALRDYGFGMAAMVDELGDKGAAKFTRHYAGAVAAAHRNERNKADPQNREWDKYFTEFRLAGGMTAGFYVKNTEEIGKDIRTMMLKAGAEPKNKTEALLASSPARAVAAAGRVLEYAGSVSENAARVAAYRTAREMGKSPSEAASIAKNLTTNFDRKGELGQVINAAYVFYNAAVQGSHRLLKMASNPKVAGYMAGFGSAGLALALANADWGGDDPDDGMAYWDKIPAYEKERNLIIMLPPSWRFEDAQRVGTDGHYVKIPLQYGLNLPVAYGYAIADVLRNHRDRSRGMSPVKAGVTMASYLAGAFNPFGGSVDLSNGSSMAQAALPSLGDAVVQFATGTNGFGRDVAPFKSPFDTKPDSENYNLRQADSVSLKIAQLLNRATGGSAAEAGGIDISAGTVENLIRNVSGGTGAFLYDVGNLAWKSVDRATGGDPDIFVREMPLARRMYGELGGDVDQGIFYDSRKKTQEAAGIVKRSAELDMEPSEENQTLARMDKFANKATRDLAKVRREMIRVKQDDSLSNTEKTKELRELRAARDQITAGFNQAFTEVMREFFAEQK